MSYTEFQKSPASVLDYSFDWSQWLESGQTVATSSWSADTGLTIDSDTQSNTKTTAIVSGGVEGNSYFVSNTVVTNDGLTVKRSFIIKVVFR
jgi:hypothetical protein